LTLGGTLLPASAFAADPSLPSLGMSLVRVGASLALVVAMLFALAALLRRLRAASRAAHSGPRLETLDRMDVGGRRELRLVRAGDRLLVVGITEERIQLLTDLDDVDDAVDVDGSGASAAPRSASPLRALAISS
jgi:flagellar protein FliO/FliZ